MSHFSKRIVYPTAHGVTVLTPCDCGLTVDEIAKKDVPCGVPYIIVKASEIPADRTYRAAWRADFSQPDGHGVGPDEAFLAEHSQ